MKFLYIGRLLLIWLPTALAQYRPGEPNGDAPNGEKGLFPHVINLATRANIQTNATCGQEGPEVYCKLTEHSSGREPQCSVCNDRSLDRARRHPITNAIDGTNSWWQSPSLAQGRKYEWVTITLDLRQVYQVAYIIVKSAISPRPGNWILERSVDGRTFKPWQYYTLSNNDCQTAFGIPATRGRPTYQADDEVICTSYFSRLNPLEGGEVHTSLVNGRPGSSGPSEALRQFTEARYIRLRLQKLRTLHGDLQGRQAQTDTSVTRRYFYSIKDISIGGRCVCNGHAENCIADGNKLARCSCVHNTCGDSCERCCPLYNQHLWRPGNFSDGAICEKCECYGHAESCSYDEEVARNRSSINIKGEYIGGGVCEDCTHHTEGINCEHCKHGYYRPQGVPPNAPRPCLPCDCSGPGTTGSCVQDDKQFNLGIFPGACICKEGFDGPRCSKCAKGYRRYPSCEPCPCSRAGSVNQDCDGECVCKDNVIGDRCDTCPTGHFYLDPYNPLGCTKCYCNAVTNDCEAASLPVYIIKKHEEWKVTDLMHRRAVSAAIEGTDVHIAHDDMSRFNTYYWLAPSDYLGKRTTSYGQTLTVKVSWVRLRGDTSGKPTRCPDVIIEGAGYRIAYGDHTYHGKKSAHLEIPLYEHGWYHFPKDLPDIKRSTSHSEWKGREVTRREMMEVLFSMETLMIRARFHSVQIEGVLHDVALEYGKEGGTATLVTGAVERCNCPEGYTGLSCETCAPGYMRANLTTYGGKCIKCDCNGHTESCDPFTGECGECLHNTFGPNCERCAPGFFGDATLGTPDACQPCACPLMLGENHFTPRCVHDLDLGGYKCKCPTGYEGKRCEQCAEGYFGNPMKPGNYCQPCNCNGNIDIRQSGNCDRFTGQCLRCTGNTAGWNCEKCRDNFYGDPLKGECVSCGCHPVGSRSAQCDAVDGQCQCKRHYTGRRCDQCVSGRGDVMEGCPKCRCDRKGAVTNICDPVSGRCSCKPGVTGDYCDQCLPDHYGDLQNGCSGCSCDSRGSYSTSCDIISGQCKCKNNVVGRNCNKCRRGYWGHVSGKGCLACDCDSVGSQDSQCDDATGQCRCRPGVGGPRCDTCLPGFYGFSRKGCKPCDKCSSTSHSCDPNTGRCICPPNTEGDSCERCSPGSWAYDSAKGCQSCNCSGPGSLSRQCDSRTGHCVCAPGYQGNRCDQCSFGHYGYPVCSPCSCVTEGTDPASCDSKGRCQCDEQGQCPCKGNVEGRVCGKCKSGTFGLSVENGAGCTTCYCFTRANHCVQAQLTWSQLALHGSRTLAFGDGETNLNVTNQLHVIPGTEGDVTIGTYYPFHAPLYWQLPREFMRDKVHSYNGYLSFTVQSSGGRDPFPDQILKTYPLVSLQGNWQLVLEYYPKEIAKDGKYKVRLHEDHWRLKNDPKKVSREMMMIALQNIQYILIRATDAADAKTAVLSDVTLDVATEGSPVSSRIAVGVEQCICPANYTGNSCQDPNIGFYRWYKKNYVASTIIIDLIGESRPCECNGRSEACDPETGECMNCRENTAGAHCEVCDTGYYGDPAIRPCKPCACPTRKQNFAETCQADRYAEYICNCKKGYTGDKCDRCDYGYYGKPTAPGGSCVLCDCDPFGSVHEGCDQNGQCTCKPGITGRDCSQCAPRHVTSEQGCISCEDGCVDVLLDEVEELIRRVTSLDLDGFIPVPWPALKEIQNLTSILRTQLNKYHSHSDVSQNMVVNFDLDYYAKDLLKRAKRLEVSALETYPPTAKINKEAQSLFDLLTVSYASIEDTVAYLKNYAIGETPSISVGAALEEVKKILKEIEMRNFTRFDVDAELELTKSISLLERINGMLITNDQIDGLKDRLKRVQGNLNDILQRITTANAKTIKARELNEENSARLARLKEHSQSIKNHNLVIDGQNFNATRFVREARGNLNTTRINYKDLEGMLTTLRNHSSVLETFEKRLSRKNKEYRDKYVKKAHDHAMDLMRESIRLESIFNETRDVADGPLRAAQAYQRIVDALRSAEEAAKNASIAANAAYEKAYPGDIEESLLHRAKQSLRQSNDLFDKGEGFRSTVLGLQTSLGDQRKALGSTRGVLDTTRERLNTLNRIMDIHMAANLSSEIESTNDRIDSIHTNVGNTQNFVNVIYTNLTIIKKKAQDLNKFDTSLLNDIREKITAAEGHTMKGVRLGNNLMKTKDRIQNRSNDLRERIEALKRKIQQTRQYASSIRVSLTTDKEGVCVRKYRPQLHPSTTTNIVLSYAINTQEKNALLLYLGSQNTSDFMAVEMVNRRIHFTWDSGGGEKRIQHPLKMQTNTDASDDTKWYHISISRIGTVGLLNVQPANSEGLLFDNSPVTGASQPGFSKMDLLPSDTLWIGGSPESAVTRLKTSSFAGCLHTVSIDGENVGLWNFTESQGCDACNEGERLLVRQEDERSVGFNGKGYFKGTNRIRRPKPYYSVVLAFKTLDEDALLFLAVNNAKNQYFSISLEDGHVVFTCQFDAQTQLTMRSSERLNNREGMTQIQATVQNRQSGGSRMGRLVVGDQDQLGTVKGGPDLDLSYVPYYFGGVDPEFDKNRWGGKLVLRSFLGCMSEFSVLDEGKNPLTDGQNYGIQRACTEKALSDVGFLGQGYVELPSAILKRESNFGFTFQTMEANALLLVSTFVGQPLAPGEVHPPDFYSVALVEGHLEIHLNGGAGMVAIMSKEKYNDGLLHSFFVIKANRKVTLKVDDIEVNSTRLERGNQVVEAPNDGGLYFGGVPPDLDVGHMVGSTRPMKGCIRDVIVNDKHISFSRPVRLRDVYIGRCADLPRRAMQGMEGDMKAIDSCQAPTQHTVEYKALKFGDQLDSHVMVPLEKNTFKKNYNISFEFRTYYPNGLFFIASHTRKKQTQAISAQLLNGRVVVMIKRRKRIYKVSSRPGLNNGKWRKVIIEKDRKRLRLIIDNNLIAKDIAPRKLNVGRELFIGGRSMSAPTIEGVQVTEALRGCLRNFNINGEEYEIPSVRRKDRIVGVGQCFASVQLGSYFPGDAYAIYSNDFNVGPILELRLEFRTWELNGIILSVADKRGTAFSLELVNGAVVTSVNMGVDHSFSSRVILRNRFTLCDNKWHTIDVNYVKDSITLRVDKYPETYGFNGVNNIIGTPTSAPLYVGGLPESELQGTLATRENFKGCIRNIVLNSERKDWTDMYHLQNVLLNACPVQ